MESRPSLVSVLLRVLPDRAADGDVVGHAEVVATGEVVPLRSTDELADLLARLAHDQGDPR